MDGGEYVNMAGEFNELRKVIIYKENFVTKGCKMEDSIGCLIG